MQKILILVSSAILLLLGGCSAQRIDIQQGNVVTQSQLATLKPGMNKRQVLFVMGTPLLQDPFHQERWDYYYSNTPGGGKTTSYRVTLHFSGDTLARVDTRGQIPEKAPSIITPQDTGPVPAAEGGGDSDSD